MSTIVRRNERSWAIDLISKINEIVDKNNLIIKRAGGEATISTERGNRMFPDVLLYKNKEQNDILQGWELKMPNIPIENNDFIKDAQRKASALNLNSFLIWNFKYAVLYVKESDTFVKAEQWDDTNFIKTRSDVDKFRNEWEQLLEKIIYKLNEYFVCGYLHSSFIGDNISNIAISLLIERNKQSVAEYIKDKSYCNSRIEAYIKNWWMNIKEEYENDERDKYKAYAKTILLNWANKILFSHIIKSRQNGALIVDTICPTTTPDDAKKIFKKITGSCDFYNIFSSIPYDELLPDTAWKDIVEISCFLKNNGIQYLDQKILQNILEYSVDISKREVNGQYTTPQPLARLLLKLTVINWSGNILDCCCGTGTIPSIAIQIKKKKMSIQKAIETVWACDKYKYPLQIANLAMAGADTVNLANRLFQHDALALSVGEKITIINPETGGEMSLIVPLFDSVVSNLPFVSFENIDNNFISKMSFSLDGRADLYQYIAIKIADVIKPGGMLGIITSNSWLGTKAGSKFVEVLSKFYNIDSVHISGKGRWFTNADIVASIIILQKKNGSETSDTCFWLWKKSLDELSNNEKYEDDLVCSSLLRKEHNPSIARLSKYTSDQIDRLLHLNISYNALFHNVEWLLKVKHKIIRIDKVFNVFRGSRRGWDALFYPEKGKHAIEKIYLKRVLINAKQVTNLIAIAEKDAFCCSLSIEELKKLGHNGALEWINRFVDQKNKVGRALPDVLKRKNMEWYELQCNEIAEIFTMMNPDGRFFFAKFENPSFINQRLIGLNHKPEYSDEELNHALLNSIFTAFYIEASGFGRGLGVLDINKDNISHSYMLNPKLVDSNNRKIIIEKFRKIKARKIMKIADELHDSARIDFEYAVLNSFGLEGFFDKIKYSLISMQQVRATVKDI